ncbi:helix-turn-helix domain-containing protein [Rhodococcus sp. MSC1_016]|jgi:hypothetical protein|uniref:helix-turn-helix domain-containing protein n=1 Tax=Rhodococcus sp. MSC1_016 TaxID=2909266 RepID=UPI0020308ACC|nr:helix-turn-helix domain-containing protein [Rhodococcus sp. MSC1_016]
MTPAWKDAAEATRMPLRPSAWSSVCRWVARFADVQLLALATPDDAGAREFVARTELREPCASISAKQFNASRAARSFFAHHNTVLNRLRRAEGMLPLSLAGNSLVIGVALEIAYWLGPHPANGDGPAADRSADRSTP